MQTDLPFWLLELVVRGRENDGDGDGDGNGGDEGDDGEDDGEEGSGEGGTGDGDSGDSSSNSDTEAEALRKALKEERRLRRKAEREAKAATKKKSEDQENQDLETARKAAQEAQQRAERLAARLRSTSVDQAIIAQARELGFIDPTDALLDSVRGQVEVDQDDEDPSDIEVDEDTVKDAVKALARKKPHLIGQPGDGSGERSGGRFRRKNGGDDGKLTEAKLQELYPGLR